MTRVKKLCRAEGCDKPSPGATVCSSCGGKLARDLGDIVALAHELDVTLSRQARMRSSSRASRPDDDDLANVEQTLPPTPSPFDYRASEAGYQLRTTLVGVVRDLATDQPLHGPAHSRCAHDSCAGVRLDQLPADELPAMAAWLLTRLDLIRVHPAADELFDELRTAVRQVRYVVDRPPDEGVFAGVCGAPAQIPDAPPCPARLYAALGASAITCRTCGAEHDVLARVTDTFATAAQIAAFLSALGTEVKASRIRKWRSRGRLEVRSVDLAGRPTYRVGDVIALLDEASDVGDTPTESDVSASEPATVTVVASA